MKLSSGLFPLPIPSLHLPALPSHPLVSVSKAVFPELPNWYFSRFVPEDPSWLDRAGNIYKEGIVNLFQGNLNLAYKRFQTVTDDYPETSWVTPSWFWQGQILAKHKKYVQAVKTLTHFLNLIKENKSTDRYVDFQNYSRYSLAWLTLRQKKYKEALAIIEKYEQEIKVNKIRTQLHFLKYLTHVLLKQSTSTFVVLEKQIQLYPFDFEHQVRLAEFYFVENRWQELADLVGTQATVPIFYNHAQMEHFLWLGTVAEINLNQWVKAKQTLLSLSELGVRNQDKLELANLRINLQIRQMKSAWENWLKIQDQVLRELALRELIHHAIKTEEFRFLLKLEHELKNITKYWRTWEAEMELIYAYLYLRQDKTIRAKQLLQSSQKNAAALEQPASIVAEEVLYFLTVIELLSSENEKAYLHLKQLLENHSGSERLSDYYFWYGVLLYEIEKSHMPAIMAMRQVAQKGARDDDRWYLLGKINHDQKKWSPAIQSFSTLKKLHPDSQFLEEGLYLQSEAYYEQKQYDSGLDILNELDKNYNSLKRPLRAIRLRVRILMAMKKFEQADTVLRMKVAEYSDFSLIKLRVEVLKNIKDPRRILNVTEVGLGLSTSEDQGFLYFHRANALFDSKNIEEAFTYYRLALKNPPSGKNRFIRFRIMIIQFQMGRFTQLEQSAAKFLKESPDDAFAYEILHLLANYYLEKKQNKKAVPYLKQLVINYKKSVRQIELAPEKRVEQVVLIGQLYNELAEYELAERWLNQALKTMETVEKGRKKWQLQILRGKGLALYKLGKHRQALAASLKVLYLDRSLSSNLRYELNIRIASSYLHLKRSKEAKAIYNKMLKRFTAADQQKEIAKLLQNLKK
ncbi:MAG: hypothetical protein H8E38_09255 [SAR324 cluster bacterium]|nr:hypothetical protein [SAR324 cluster bacterium]